MPSKGYMEASHGLETVRAKVWARTEMEHGRSCSPQAYGPLARIQAMDAAPFENCTFGFSPIGLFMSRSSPTKIDDSFRMGTRISAGGVHLGVLGGVDVE